MHIFMVGVDHTTATIAFRERLACTARQIPQVLQSAKKIVQECVLLSTCNRLELYTVCSEVDAVKTELLTILSELGQMTYEELGAHCISYVDVQAILHLFGVSSGLYSLIPGEPQIQGQVADALEIAQGGGFAGPITSALFRAALVTGKRARSETGISRNAASISHVAVQLARKLFPQLNEASILLVGSGKMSELAARNLCDNGARRLVIVNRTSEHALSLAQKYGVIHRTFSELSQALVEADVVISSTTAPHAIITYEMLQRVMHQRNNRSLLLIDIALPRDIEAAVASISGVHLYNLDDLQTDVDEGIRLRLQETELVNAIIAQEAESFGRWLRSLSVVGTINDLRQYTDILRQKELARTMRQLPLSLSEREIDAVQELTTRLVNKILHKPMLRLKDAAAMGQGHIYAEALRYLFDLEDNDETHYHWDTRQQAGDDPDTNDHKTTAPTLVESGDNY